MRGNKLAIVQLVEQQPRTVRELAELLDLRLNCVHSYLTELRELGFRFATEQIPHGHSGKPNYRYRLATL